MNTILEDRYRSIWKKIVKEYKLAKSQGLERKALREAKKIAYKNFKLCQQGRFSDIEEEYRISGYIWPENLPDDERYQKMIRYNIDN